MQQAVATGSVAANGAEETARAQRRFWGLTLGSIGVVYGDIGTSPLYAVRESVLAAVGPHAPASDEVILGILSLIVWALILIVSIKYVTILLRANNNGEGGTLALMALAQRVRHRDRVRFVDEAGRPVEHDAALIARVLDEELARLITELPQGRDAGDAATLTEACRQSRWSIEHEVFNPR